MRGGRIAVLVAATALSAWPAPAADVQIRVKDIYFTPTPRIITVGDTVTWVNEGDLGHTVTSFPGAPASFDSSTGSDVCDDGNPLTEEQCLEPGQRFEYTFTKPGIYDYRCKPHGTTDAKPSAGDPDDQQPCGMCGRIDVRAASTTSEPTDRPTLERSRTPDPTPTVSPSASPSASVDPSATPSGEPTDDGSPVAAPQDGSGGAGRALVALLAIAMLSGAGFLTWRRFLATR